MWLTVLALAQEAILSLLKFVYFEKFKMKIVAKDQKVKDQASDQNLPSYDVISDFQWDIQLFWQSISESCF